MKKIVFSGIQPSGIIHIGNYLGAISNWVKLQDEVDVSYFCIVDLHAITANNFNPEKISGDILQNLAIYLATGLDPKKSIIFQQSDVKAHAELGWILNIVTTIGELNRMTQFKEKGTGRESVNAGLFSYPVLQAADILLYKTTDVPVGEDQEQHVELSRVIARRFNNRFGNTFIIPKSYTTENKRVMSLNNPEKKMSKSLENSYISLLDSPATIKQRIDSAVSDSTTDASGAGGKNLFLLLESFAEEKIIAKHKQARELNKVSYSELKHDITDAIISFTSPIIEKTDQLLAKKNYLLDILEDGANRANIEANKTLDSAYQAIGLSKKKL